MLLSCLILSTAKNDGNLSSFKPCVRTFLSLTSRLELFRERNIWLLVPTKKIRLKWCRFNLQRSQSLLGPVAGVALIGGTPVRVAGSLHTAASRLDFSNFDIDAQRTLIFTISRDVCLQRSSLTGSFQDL